MSSENELIPSAMAQKLAVKIVGLGGAGLNIIDHIARSDLRDLPCLAVHTNGRGLAHSAATDKLLLGLKTHRGLGSGGDPDMGEAAAEEEIIRLREACAGNDLIFLIGGLGGGTATGAAPIWAQVAKETGALVLAVVTLPFEFEGARRQRQAQLGLQRLKTAADGVICLPHQKVVKLIDENTSFQETFAIANEMLTQGVRGLWQMLTRQGLINVDFADLSSVLRGRHAESAFATARAQGEGRTREVMERLLASPLLDEGQTLGGADALLVSLVGGPDLTLDDVNRVMEQINRQAESAHLVMGAAIAEEFQGRLEVTLFAAKRNQPAPDAESDRNGAEIAKSANGKDSIEVIESQFFGARSVQRPPSRYLPPPPELSSEKKEQLLARQNASSLRTRKAIARWRQGQLPLEIVSKGRFEKIEPTIHHGEDLDVPTYIRRGIALN